MSLGQQSESNIPRRAPSAARLCLFALLSFSLCGCMFRRMTIRTDPPGALVILDGEEVGFTPYTTDFTYYGTREITLVSPGYETLTVQQRVPTPWYQVPPLDFVSDNFLPFKLTNRHDFSYRLQPARQVPAAELMDRANSFRSEAEVGP